MRTSSSSAGIQYCESISTSLQKEARHKYRFGRESKNLVTTVSNWKYTFEEPAQNGHGIEPAARRAREFLCSLAARIRPLCA
jgi:hypothetical protein